MQAGMAAKPVLGRRFSRKQESSHTFQASIDSSGRPNKCFTLLREISPTKLKKQMKHRVLEKNKITEHSKPLNHVRVIARLS